jgi:tetratricopeptide (TPR) repeat protein
MPTRPMKCAMIWLATAAALASQSALAESIRFSNIRFDDGGNWIVVQQSPEMILRSTNETIGSQARIVITPAAPFPGTLEEARDTAWTVALAGRATRDEVAATEERPIAGDGIEREIGAAVAPAGGVYVVVVKSGDFATRMTLTADTDISWSIGAVFFAPLLASLEVAKDEPPPSTVAGKGGGGGGSSVTRQFDWDGPDGVDYGIYDHNCLRYGQEFNALVVNGDRLIGSVTPQAVSWQQTLDTVRATLADPSAKAAYDTVREFASVKRPDLFSAGAAASLMQGGPAEALAQFYAGVEQAPDDADLLFNFAAMLSQAGMPNESLAVIKRLRSLDRKPALANGVDADAALAYLTGYAEMLRGELADAKAQFARTISSGPYLYEAKHALALIQAHEGGRLQGEDTYLDGMWRFKPKELVICGVKRDKSVRPPVDEMFDTSMGVPGELVKFRHPSRTDDLEKWGREIAALGAERGAIAKQAGDRMKALSSKLSWSTKVEPIVIFNQKMSLLLESIDENEPYIVALMADEEAIRESALQGVQAAVTDHLERTYKIAMSGAQNICQPLRASATRGIQEAGPHLRQIELAMRRTARDWYKITTGLNAKIGDKDWHEFNDQSLRVQLETLNALMLLSMSTGYGPFGADTQCQEEPPDQQLAGQMGPQGSPCDDIFGDLKISHSFEVPGRTDGPKISYEVGCDKIKADIQYDLLAGKAFGFGTAMGGIASIEIGRKGDYSIFAGARAEASGPGMGGGIKSGLYMEGDNGGVTGIGGRVSLDAKAGFGKLSKSASDDMKFNLLPDPPKAPRGSRLKTFNPPP